MPYKTILFEKKNKIGYVTLNRPKVLNAWNHQMTIDLMNVFKKMRNDPEVEVVIFKGRGKAFCSGADVRSEFEPSGLADWLGYAKMDFDLFGIIRKFEKPIIVAIHGYCIGGALGLALCCDILVAAENAKFSQPQVRIGISPLPAPFLARLVGRTRAMEICLTGEMFDAQEAYRIGLVNRVVPLEELLPTAKKIAKRIISNAPLAVRLGKECVNTGLELTFDQYLTAEVYRHFATYQTEDIKEGPKAILEKREPKFKGR